MKLPSFKNVKLPAGAVPSNWYVLVMIGLSAVLFISIMFSGEPIMPDNDPLDVEPAPLEDFDVTTPDGYVVDQVDQRAELLRAQQAEREREAAAAAERLRRESAQEARANAAALAAAQDRLNALRRRQNQNAAVQPTPVPEEMVANTSDEADLLETFRLEELARQVNALRAPFVMSSARGIGERRHEVPQFVGTRPGAQAPSRPAPRAPAAPSPVFPPEVADALGPPPAVPPAPPARPAALPPPIDPGTGLPRQRPGALAPAPAPRMTPRGVAPYGTPAAGAAVDAAPGGDGTFDLGPAADGGYGDSPPFGVVVTPNDGRSYRLYEGTYIPAVLQNQISGDFEGTIIARVSRHVYSVDRQRILIPRGTTAIGTSSGVTDLWQGRIAIGFHRLVFPDGGWVNMRFSGLNRVGESSVSDQVDRHYLQLFGVAGAVGVLAGFSHSNQSGGFRSAASEQMASTALQIVNQFLNRLPTVTIRAGHVVNIQLTGDLLVPHHLSWDVQ